MSSPIGLAPPLYAGSARRQSLALRRAETTTHTDTFCVMPARMRVLCLLLSLFLFISLMAAIVNSMQTATTHSESYCRELGQEFSPENLKIIFGCPPESVLFYYSCCEPNRCCANPKIWMM
ncbi:hypothetical protein M3Y97_00676000 [Aphelenchoides bicaudatus]|nr:hypothetical protein M3Y97_00676000 [Aphelenchoides bicaudatus]